jgi:hypothetical protein
MLEEAERDFFTMGFLREVGASSRTSMIGEVSNSPPPRQIGNIVVASNINVLVAYLPWN